MTTHIFFINEILLVVMTDRVLGPSIATYKKNLWADTRLKVPKIKMVKKFRRCKKTQKLVEKVTVIT